ncbi:HSF-type DNA-binding-domain-containing protein [Pilobolus umbonatus]|nr:HSF-type DNA-binding-domain-containing protein [Pilobolus umbonatus]
MDYQNYSVDSTNSIQYQQYPYTVCHRPLDPTLQILQPSEDTALMRLPQSPWNHGLMPSDMDYEDINQSERGIAGFVSKLYQCLQAPDDGQKYARWCRHNGIYMFIIDCIPKFTEIVLPKLFKHCKFASFVRQLNIYGFQRDTDARKSKDSKDKETCRWHHIHFRPGRRDLFHLIRRKTPRYSRRKRSKTDEDPDTILNTGSGDESDNEDTVDPGDRRQSGSSVSSTVILQQPNISADYKNPPLHMIFENPQEIDLPEDTTPSYLYPSNLQLSTSPEINTTHFSPPIKDESEGEFEQADDNDNNNNNHHHPHDLMMHHSLTQEEELRSQMLQLRRGYLRMYKFLTDEVNKAYNIVEIQRSRIEFLESSLRNNLKERQNPSHFIDTINNPMTPTNYFPVDYVMHQSPIEVQTAPNTPIYPSGIMKSNDVFLTNNERSRIEQNYNFFFSSTANPPVIDTDHLEEDIKLSSPCSAPEKYNSHIWLSNFNQEPSITTLGNESKSRYSSNGM